MKPKFNPFSTGSEPRGAFDRPDLNFTLPSRLRLIHRCSTKAKCQYDAAAWGVISERQNLTASAKVEWAQLIANMS
ncbi:hypothetical protein I7I53_00063 [Histoplasma capsulatum var. duboisii H88]|uniref:Uncharacterized protein n=1 Tax=Ajellomyces capsulatus (strain H88) TaxID=544711 RepID=A0A8A1LM79_AJEC8|nr:hypothetical protein I7I53_00063 [Histoplasma capsulatum var. duboisii H88]